MKSKDKVKKGSTTTTVVNLNNPLVNMQRDLLRGSELDNADTIDEDPLEEHPGSALEVDRLTARLLFDKVDKDCNGIITLDEIVGVVRDINSDEGLLLHALLQLPKEVKTDDGTLEMIERHFFEMDRNYQNGVDFEGFYEYISHHLFLDSLSERLQIMILKQKEDQKRKQSIQEHDWDIHIPSHVCVTEGYALWVPLDRAVQVFTSMLSFLSEEDSTDVLRLMEKSACFLTSSGKMESPDATHSVVRFAMRQFVKVCNISYHQILYLILYSSFFLQ